MTPIAMDALVHSETLRTRFGTFILSALQHPSGNRSLRITRATGDSAVNHVLTISDADIETFHRAYLRVAKAVRPSSRLTHPRSYERWSPAEDDHVRNAILNGASPERVAISLDRSRSAVVARMNILGLPRHRNAFPAFQDARVAAGHASPVYPTEAHPRERAERRSHPDPLF